MKKYCSGDKNINQKFGDLCFPLNLLIPGTILELNYITFTKYSDNQKKKKKKKIYFRARKTHLIKSAIITSPQNNCQRPQSFSNTCSESCDE